MLTADVIKNKDEALIKCKQMREGDIIFIDISKKELYCLRVTLTRFGRYSFKRHELGYQCTFKGRSLSTLYVALEKLRNCTTQVTISTKNISVRTQSEALARLANEGIIFEAEKINKDETIYTYRYDISQLNKIYAAIRDGKATAAYTHLSLLTKYLSNQITAVINDEHMEYEEED